MVPCDPEEEGEGEGVVNPPAPMFPSEEVHSPRTHHSPNRSAMPPAALQPASLMFLSTLETYPLTPRASSARAELVLARALKRSSSRRSDHSQSPASMPKSPAATSALGSVSPHTLTSPRFLGDEDVARQMESKAIEDRRNHLMLSSRLYSLESVVETLEATLRHVAVQAQTQKQVCEGLWSKSQASPGERHKASADAKMLDQRYAP